MFFSKVSFLVHYNDISKRSFDSQTLDWFKSKVPFYFFTPGPDLVINVLIVIFDLY